MEKNKFNSGQLVYLISGEEAYYVGPVQGEGHIVRLIYIREEDELGECREFEGPPEIVREIFSSPVTVKVNEQVAKLEKIKSELIAEITKLGSGASTFRAENAKFLEASRLYPEVRQLIDFMERKITHVVCVSLYSPCHLKILTFDEAFTSKYYGAIDGMRLLCLFGTDRYNRATQWRLNSYRDGSGDWVDIIPFYSEEEAKQFVQKTVDDCVDAYLDDKKPIYPLDISSILMMHDWLKVSEKWKKKTATKAISSKQKIIDELEKRLKKEQEALNTIQAAF